MNRRTFLAALAALPVVGRVFAEEPVEPVIVGECVNEGSDDFVWPDVRGMLFGDQYRVARVMRAASDLREGDFVRAVGESDGWPLVEPIPPPIDSATLSGAVGWTTCDVDAWNFTVITMAGPYNFPVKGAAE